MSDTRARDSYALRTIPLAWKSVNPAGGDVDLTVLWADQKFACVLRNGAAAAADIAVTTTDGVTVTFANVPSGGEICGLFAALKAAASGTTATGILAGK